MDKRFLTVLIVVWTIMAAVGLWKSHVTGIQPGYFEKAEAPAYGVGGMDKMAANIDEKTQEYYKELYKEE